MVVSPYFPPTSPTLVNFPPTSPTLGFIFCFCGFASSGHGLPMAVMRCVSSVAGCFPVACSLGSPKSWHLPISFHRGITFRCMVAPHFTYPDIGWRTFRFFYSMADKNNVAVNTSVCTSLAPGVAGSRVNGVKSLEGLLNCFPKRLHRFIFPPAVAEGSSSARPRQHLSSVFFARSILAGVKCDFDLYFPDGR